MTYVTVFNAGDSPTVLSDDGKTIGGGEWAPALSTDDAVKSALADSRLVVVEVPDADVAGLDPRAKEALGRTAEFADRYDALKDWDKATLAKFAVKEGLVGGDATDLHVAELRRLITESGTDLPTPAAAKKAVADKPAK